MKDCTELASPSAPSFPKHGQIKHLFPPPLRPRTPPPPSPQSDQITGTCAGSGMEESNASGLVMPDLSSMFCVPLGAGVGGGKINEVSRKCGCDLVSFYQSHFSSKSGIYQTLRKPQVLGSHSFPFLLSLLTCNQLCFNCIKTWNPNAAAFRAKVVL